MTRVLCLVFVLWGIPAFAEVTRVQMTTRADTSVAGYERISGRVFFSVDPAHPRNAVIVDLGTAPKNAQDRVEFSADFVVLRPKSGGNGVAIVDVPNRGNARLVPMFNRARGGTELGDGFLMQRGFTVVLVGWQHDVAGPADNLLRIQVPGTPPVGGLGFAAVRDVASWIKYVPGAVTSARHVYAFGQSQSGRYLRDFLYHGFNTDEQGRQVFDAVMPHIAGAARIDLNRRGGSPNPADSVATAFPFSDRAQRDPASGVNEGLLDNDRARRNQPKIFYTNTDVEYWSAAGRAAALVHTSVDGTRDLDLPDNVRVFHIAGTQHTPGAFPPVKTNGQQMANPADDTFVMRALLVAMDRWVREGVAPPASRHPRLSDRTLVTPADVAFPAIPGVQRPSGLRPAARVANTLVAGGAGAGNPLPYLVPQVDADGNDRGGIRIPEVAVPLATYTGWNFGAGGSNPSDRLVNLLGSYVPFPRTKAEREQRGDPRRAIQERYASRDAFLAQTRAAALALVRDRYMLSEDVDAVLQRAGAHWDLLMGESRFSVVEASMTDMRKAMEEGRATSRELVQQSLTRIALYEDRLNAIITVNPRALEDAEARDRERRAGRVRGPLHGIPIALKDNIQTSDMRTTAGALAFAELVPPYDATVTTLLREAGAVIVAKTQLTELANWVTAGMPANYNALTGYGFNPYDPRRDPRPATADGRPALAPGGSSSGVGTAVSFWAANVGTETSGSIVNPANQNMLVGIKPTVGRVSRHGIIPITADQDTAGPMARSVTDAAILLGALEGATPDPHDPATSVCTPPPDRDYTRFLDAGALKGARIGVPRAFFVDPVTPPGATAPQGGLNAEQRAALNEAIGIMKAQGATIVDPADVPSVIDTNRDRNFLSWPVCSGPDVPKGKDANCSTTYKYGMKRDFTKWLALLGDSAPVTSLAELRAWNEAHRSAGAIKYGQSNLDNADEIDLVADKARYEADRRKDLELTATRGIDALMAAHMLDAVLLPGPTSGGIGARAGYPTVIVPFAMVPNAPTPPFPGNFRAAPAPFGMSFTARPCGEPKLIALAYAFEQATRRRRPPLLFP